MKPRNRRAGKFCLQILGGSLVLLGRQRRERGLLLMALSGYASVYNMNTCLQFNLEKSGCFGARG
jgi:hypothetical protein